MLHRGATDTLVRSPQLKVLVEVNPTCLEQMASSAEELLTIFDTHSLRLFEIYGLRQELHRKEVGPLSYSSPDKHANLLCLKG